MKNEDISIASFLSIGPYHQVYEQLNMAYNQYMV